MNNQKINKIRVAILAEEPFFWRSRKYYHKLILDGFTWGNKNNKFTFNVTFLYDKDIIRGKLNRQNFDVLVIPGGGIGNNEALLKGLTFLPKVRKFKNNIANFVKNGGGILGICGGAALITDLKVENSRKPTTLTERLYNKSSLNISCVSSYFRTLAFPIFYTFQYKYPEKIGNSAYAFSFAPGQTVDGKYIMTTGCPLDLQIYKDNPIFQDSTEDTRRIRWWAGQSLILPENPNREVKILARYPKTDISSNDSAKIYAWRYIGGIRGLIRAILKSFKTTKKYDLGSNFVPLLTFYLAGDWEVTKTIIDLDMGNKPCITAEIYPNQHKGRIILSMVHTEYMVWWGGYIKSNYNDNFNCIGNGLHQWKDIDKLSTSLQKELTYNWWILRRFVAWLAKVPDNDLPPIKLGEITENVKETLIKNIFWDGREINRLKSI